MSVGPVLSAAGLIRRTRRRGFCPLCRVWDDGAEGESSPPALTALVFLGLAALAWALTIWQARSADEMAMGVGSVDAFATGWAVMIAAMMIPSAIPLIYEFARRSEGRMRWQAATAVLAGNYLAIWLAVGLAFYVVLAAFPIPGEFQSVAGGLALGLAGLYALTPVKKASEARCRELCCLHGPLPFNLMRSAIVVGAKYALSCVGCSAGLMIALLIIGMANVGWMVILAAVLVAYKLGPPPSLQRRWLTSALLVALGVVYAVMG